MNRHILLFLFTVSISFGQMRKGDAFRNTIDSLNRVAFDDPDRASRMADSMLVIAHKKNRPIDSGLLLLVKGITETSKGNNENALKYHMKAYGIFDSLELNEGKVFSLGNLASVALNMENYVKAREYLNRALRITDKNDANNLKNIYINLGVSYDYEGNHKMAIDYYKKAVPYTTKSENYNSAAMNFHNMAVAYGELGDFKNAEYYGLKALEYQQKTGSVRTLVIVATALGNLYTDHNELAKGKEFLEIAGKAAHRLKTPYYLEAYYEEYYRWLLKSRDYKTATQYADSLITIKNAIHSEDQLKATTELEARFENNLKSKEIELLKVQKELQDAAMKRNVTWRYILALITALCLIIIFILYRNYKLKQRANQLLSMERDELEKQNLQLENENIMVQFETLRNQVSPHFLFNSLNALSSLIKTNQQKAVEFTNLFSRIFRSTLELKEKHLITLEEELQHVNAYLELQKMRFDENLLIDTKIDVAVLGHYLPPFSLQMVIENAVKHNIISSESPLQITIGNTADYLVVANSLQRRSYVEDSTKTGLKNIISRYRYITDLVPVFEIRDGQFVVELPILKEEN